MCVSKIKEIHARVTEFCSGNEMRTDIRGDANTPRPHFVRRGIKTRTKTESIAPSVSPKVKAGTNKVLLTKIVTDFASRNLTAIPGFPQILSFLSSCPFPWAP